MIYEKYDAEITSFQINFSIKSNIILITNNLTMYTLYIIYAYIYNYRYITLHVVRN